MYRFGGGVFIIRNINPTLNMTHKDWDDLNEAQKGIRIFGMLEKLVQKHEATERELNEFKTFKALHEQAMINRDATINNRFTQLETRFSEVKDEIGGKVESLEKSINRFMDNCTGPTHAKLFINYRVWLVLLSMAVAVLYGILGAPQLCMMAIKHLAG